MTFPKVYAVKHKKLDVRMNSVSGGAFTALSDYVLDNGGVVYGCILNNKLEAVHVRAENKEQRNKMRGSKYIQSQMGTVFKDVKNDLNNGIKVLFTGTSCQIAGLKSFLGDKYSDLLICVDILCHGVPSMRVWRDHLKYYQEKYDSKCIGVHFRNKKRYGWSDSTQMVILKNKRGKIRRINTLYFALLFGHCNIIRESCFVCPYKGIKHPGDITIGDFWGINRAVENFDDNNGVSIVLVNSETGLNVFNSVLKELDYKECRLEDSINQLPLKQPHPKPGTYENFWNDYESLTYKQICNKYLSSVYKHRLGSEFKMIKRMLLNRKKY